jgi:hypothetical protein
MSITIDCNTNSSSKRLSHRVHGFIWGHSGGYSPQETCLYNCTCCSSVFLEWSRNEYGIGGKGEGKFSWDCKVMYHCSLHFAMAMPNSSMHTACMCNYVRTVGANHLRGHTNSVYNTPQFLQCSWCCDSWVFTQDYWGCIIIFVA